MARASKVFVVACVALLLAGTAAADLGSFSFSHSASTSGSDQIDFALTSSTTGTSYGFPFEWIQNYVWMSHYSTGYGWQYWTTSDWDYRYVATTSPAVGYRMALASNFSFTPLPPGWYWYWATGRAWGYTYPGYSVTSAYDYGHRFRDIGATARAVALYFSAVRVRHPLDCMPSHQDSARCPRIQKHVL
jgi:hypothetical protein